MVCFCVWKFDALSFFLAVEVHMSQVSIKPPQKVKDSSPIYATLLLLLHHLLHQTFHSNLLAGGVMWRMLEAKGAYPLFLFQAIFFLSSTPPSVHHSSPDSCWEAKWSEYD